MLKTRKKLTRWTKQGRKESKKERNTLTKVIADLQEQINNLKSDVKKENGKQNSSIRLLQSFVVMQAEITDGIMDRNSKTAQEKRGKLLGEMDKVEVEVVKEVVETKEMGVEVEV